jgi:hypothetical protein
MPPQTTFMIPNVVSLKIAPSLSFLSVWCSKNKGNGEEEGATNEAKRSSGQKRQKHTTAGIRQWSPT